MIKERIEDLVQKGYITQVETAENLAKLSESELVEKGYITQAGIFDGSDDTIDEVPVVDPVEPEDEPVVDEGEEDEPVVNPDDAPVVDEPEDEPVADLDDEQTVEE